MKMDKEDHKPLHGARKNIKKVRKSLVTSGFFKKSGDIFFGATSQKRKTVTVRWLFFVSKWKEAGLEPIAVQTLVATSIFPKGENANRVLLP